MINKDTITSWEIIDNIIKNEGVIHASKFLVEEYGIPLMDARLTIEDYSQKEYIGLIDEKLYNYLRQKLEIKSRNIDSIYIRKGTVFFPCFYIGIKTKGLIDFEVAKVRGEFTGENYQILKSTILKILQVEIENMTGI